MEYCGAGSVSDLMRILKRELTEDQIAIVAKYTLEVLPILFFLFFLYTQGLAYLHKERKIHRDIKAGNILLNDAGEGKLGELAIPVPFTILRNVLLIFRVCLSLSSTSYHSFVLPSIALSS